MKKHIAYLILATVAITTGCSLERTPLTGPSTGTFPASFDEAQAGVLAAYKNLANDIQQYEPFPGRWMDQLTDIGAMRTVLSRWPDYTQSIITSSYSGVEDFYARIYKGLGRVHLVLDNLDNLQGVIEDEQYYQLKAELLCLRAYFYDWACKVYGDVPFIDHCLTLDDYAYARTPKAEVIERILADMDDELLDRLPVAWTKQIWGTARIGRVAAYTLKARICLEWGFWEDAATYSKKALELADGVYDLTPLDYTYYPTHVEGEPDQTPLFGFAAETGSKEWIWAIQFNRLAAANTHTGIYTGTSRVHNGAAGAGPSMAMMDSFQCTDGLSIAQSALYDWQNPWKNRDPRLDLYCARSGSRTMGIQFSIDPADKTVYDYVSGTSVSNADVTGNKSEYGPNGIQGPGGYLWRKFNDPAYYGSITGTDYEDDLDVPVIRFAELLLIDAEANIEWEGGDLARAKSQIDRVRARVNMPDVDGSTREALRSALRYERKVELCAEGFRWFDIRRCKESDGITPVALKAIDGPQYAPAYGRTTSNAKPIIDANWIVTYDANSTFDGSAFNARVHTERVFTLNKDELWPFPYSEMITNPLIGTGNNNPGY
jgi:hypothetical protein